MYAERVLVNIRKIIRSVDIHSKHLISQFGLTGPQLIVLNEIVRRKKAPTGEIAQQVSLSQGTLTSILDRLEKNGYVARERSTSDRRKVLVSPTEKAEKIIESKPSLLQERFAKRFELLPEWEQAMLVSSLTRVVDMMEMIEDTKDSSPILTSGNISSPIDSNSPTE